MKVLFFLIAISLPELLTAQDQWKNVYTESAWAERDIWQNAQGIIDKLSIGTGSVAADVGCHEGYMTMKLSKAVGNHGRVYAVDVEPTRLDKLRSAIQSKGITNVEVVQGDYDDPKLPADSLDAVLIMDTYHEMKSHDLILLKIKIALKPEGRLVVCEPIAEDRRKWTRAQQEARHEIAMAFVIGDLLKAGFRIVFKQDRFVDREKVKGDKMWILVASKQ